VAGNEFFDTIFLLIGERDVGWFLPLLRAEPINAMLVVIGDPTLNRHLRLAGNGHDFLKRVALLPERYGLDADVFLLGEV